MSPLDAASRPDPWRRLLDAVLNADNHSLEEMADGADTSPFHFTRQVRRGSGEPPIALRRRITLERAAWLIQRGTSVTDCAFDSGYESVEGFSRAFARAFGHPPTAMPPATDRGHWLPAPNGLHFHSPTVLYVDAGTANEHSAGDVVALMVRHDLDDTRELLSVCGSVNTDDYRRSRLVGHQVLPWHGPEESIAAVATRLVRTKLPWLATVEGSPAPDLDGPDDVASLRGEHERIAPRWLALIREIERADAWTDVVIDALCDPPESFLMSQIVAHELTFAAHRRQLIRWMLSDAGIELSTATIDPDPIMWHRRSWHAES
ncbi:helix-turn-helix domain-containing protein [Gordonia sp. CPCC 205333]|uniref:helix-turn-helix domain-containing protein n=1 Tax=Gordonia sp. CPCC 205333 TaxID=3140790 RepID=UPI003AF36F8F